MAVVDIDDTLLNGGRLSRFFWRLSLSLQRVGRRLQRVNSPLLEELRKYETILILSGRDNGEVRFTQTQLRRAGVRFDKLICCPRKELINSWKASVVSSLDRTNGIVWIDDIFESHSLKESLFSPDPNVRTVPPTRLSDSNRNRSSELEWL